MSRPLFRPAALLLACLSLSIGWGIRGNFGSEYGAMIPGALSGLAVALLSGREDWRSRAPYFAFFGAIGWAFGGSMSYMPTLAYTHSGRLPTQIYGFFAVFCIGFLWAFLGGAGTAYAAVETRERLTAIFRPLCWVLAAWTLHTLFWPEHHGFRQLDPFYWLDSVWVPNIIAILALCGFDLWDRKFEKIGWLTGAAVIGSVLGLAVQKGVEATGWISPLLAALVHRQGDLSAIDPATGHVFESGNLIVNWPQIFADLGPHLGWIFGFVGGIAVYFFRFGKWRSGCSLMIQMAVWGLGTFIALPVLLSNLFRGVGGFRLVPPRGDDWAIVLGLLIGLLRYVYRNKLEAVAAAAWISGVVGGLGLMVAQFLKLLAFMPGNPVLTQDQATIDSWSHWHNANWHSILAEQFAGLLYGLGIVLALGLISPRLPSQTSEPRVRRWTEAFSVSFILAVLVYVNLVKNVGDWTKIRTGGFQSMPLVMKAPLFPSLELSALGWFNLLFLAYAAVLIYLVFRHLRRPLAIMPSPWLGKGQLMFLVFLWIMVIGNSERVIVAFDERRLATEAVIFLNAVFATLLVLVIGEAHQEDALPALFKPFIRKAIIYGGLTVILFDGLFTSIVHGTYGNRHDGWGTANIRFGPNADWRLRPLEKTRQHR